MKVPLYYQKGPTEAYLCVSTSIHRYQVETCRMEGSKLCQLKMLVKIVKNIMFSNLECTNVKINDL